MQPFANILVTKTLTGAQLRQVLEEQWQPAASTRPFLKLGMSKSLEYRYDPTAAAGGHITAITLNGLPVASTDSWHRHSKCGRHRARPVGHRSGDH